MAPVDRSIPHHARDSGARFVAIAEAIVSDLSAADP
jgi:hypothetical protein